MQDAILLELGLWRNEIFIASLSFAQDERSYFCHQNVRALVSLTSLSLQRVLVRTK